MRYRIKHARPGVFFAQKRPLGWPFWSRLRWRTSIGILGATLCCNEAEARELIYHHQQQCREKWKKRQERRDFRARIIPM